MADAKTPPKFILVSGGIAVGKTTIASQLTHFIPNAQLFEEIADKNPYLTKFYKDMKAWSFHSRIAFLEMRTKIYREVHNDAKYVLIDRSLHELKVFANALHDLGHFVGDEYDTFLSLYDTLVFLSPPPNLILYINCSVSTALQRIKERARPYELQVNPDYLNLIYKSYEEWLATFGSSKIIRVNTDTFDAYADSSVKQLANTILQKI